MNKCHINQNSLVLSYKWLHTAHTLFHCIIINHCQMHWQINFSWQDNYSTVHNITAYELMLEFSLSDSLEVQQSLWKGLLVWVYGRIFHQVEGACEIFAWIVNEEWSRKHALLLSTQWYMTTLNQSLFSQKHYCHQGDINSNFRKKFNSSMRNKACNSTCDSSTHHNITCLCYASNVNSLGYTGRRGLVLKVAMAKGGNKARTEPEESTKPSILDCLTVLNNVPEEDFHTKLTGGYISKTSESPVRSGINRILEWKIFWNIIGKMWGINGNSFQKHIM